MKLDGKWRMSEKNESKRKIPTHPGFPIFVRHTEDVMKNILDLPLSLNPPALIILHCVCVCVSKRGKNVDGNASDFLFLFLFYVFCICHQELCGSIADRPQGRCSTQSHTSRGRHTDDTLREEGGRASLALRSRPNKKKRVARKKKKEKKLAECKGRNLWYNVGADLATSSSSPFNNWRTVC